MHGGDPERHLTTAELDARFASAPSPPRDRGSVKRLVARGPGEARALVSAVTLAPDLPFPGDRWSFGRDPTCASQITAMEHAVGSEIANGQCVSLFGDNLLLDLALDAANLPVGSRVRIGTALLEVTGKAHNGCKKYAARFGVAALAWISARTRRSRRLRGIHLRVIEPGRVAIGDPAEVVFRSQELLLPATSSRTQPADERPLRS